MNLTISLRKFLESVSASSGLDYDSCESMLNELTAYITLALSRGESVNVKRIGTFRMIDDDVVFAPDGELAEKINMPFSAFEAVELPDQVTDEMLDNAAGQQESAPEATQTPKQIEEPVESPVTITAITEERVEAKNVTEQQPEADVEEETEVTPPPFLPPIPNIGNSEAESSPENVTEPDVEELPDAQETETKTEAATETVTPPPPVPHVEPETEADDEPQDDYNENSGSRRKKVWIAAFIAGIICFATGYVMGRWLGTSDSVSETAITEEAAQTDPESVANMSEPDTIVAIVEQEPEPEQKQEPVVQEPVVKETQPQPVVTDTIKRNRFLTTMSRQYYGRMEFWVYIYEENASKLGNPNKLEAGTVVVIPPAEKYGIDASDPASVAKAEEKAKEIAAQYAR